MVNNKINQSGNDNIVQIGYDNKFKINNNKFKINNNKFKNIIRIKDRGSFIKGLILGLLTNLLWYFIQNCFL
ncbi:MAG: hypothetical protein ACTTI1_04135 [Prevotella intermedia]